MAGGPEAQVELRAPVRPGAIPGAAGPDTRRGQYAALARDWAVGSGCGSPATKGPALPPPPLRPRAPTRLPPSTLSDPGEPAELSPLRERRVRIPAPPSAQRREAPPAAASASVVQQGRLRSAPGARPLRPGVGSGGRSSSRSISRGSARGAGQAGGSHGRRGRGRGRDPVLADCKRAARIPREERRAAPGGSGWGAYVGGTAGGRPSRRCRCTCWAREAACVSARVDSEARSAAGGGARVQSQAPRTASRSSRAREQEGSGLGRPVGGLGPYGQPGDGQSVRPWARGQGSRAVGLAPRSHTPGIRPLGAASAAARGRGAGRCRRLPPVRGLQGDRVAFAVPAVPGRAAVL